MFWFADPLGQLAGPPVGRSRRISSNEQPAWNDGNMDMSILPPGHVVEMPLLEGPGAINHIWFTSHAGGQGMLNGLTLRIYWDGRDEPGVEVPLGDFFAFGDGPVEVVESLPVQVSPTGSLTCFWRMPFARSARITVTNDNPDLRTGLYWQIDWVELPELPPDTPYFHARYRQEYPAQPGDYLIFEGEGRGRYVGTVFSVTYCQDGWFGEGDDFFYIDGEPVPSLQGTGSEDYFNDAWGFRRRTSQFFGQPRCEGWQAGDRTTCYRWHIPDPVMFAESLKVTIEHKGNAPDSRDFWYLERPDFLASIAFWYQVGEPKPFGCLPPWPERRVPWCDLHLLTVLRQAETSDPAPEPTLAGMFGGQPSLLWRDPPAGATLTLPFEVAEAGRHALRLIAAGGPGMGRFELLVDGAETGRSIDLTGERGARHANLGTPELGAGGHTVGFRSQGAGGLQAEYLRALHLPPAAERQPKTDNEAHFYRIGISRAVYTYRLVNGRLPHDLTELLQAKLIDESYLHDEHGQPLRSEVRGDRFWVGARDWEGSWQGLDSRR